MVANGDDRLLRGSQDWSNWSYLKRLATKANSKNDRQGRAGNKLLLMSKALP